MHKYWAIFKLSIISSLQYKAHGAIYTIFDLVPPLISIAYWNTAFATQSVIIGYERPALIAYLLMTGVARTLLISYPEYELMNHINQGQLSRYLVKPVSFIKQQFLGELAFKANRSLFTLPALAFLLWLSTHLTGSLPHLTLTPLILIMLLNSFMIGYLIKFIIGLSSFWTSEIGWLVNINELFSLILSGSLLPLEFFPGWFRQLSHFLPFEHTIYIPAKAVLGQLSLGEIHGSLIIQWCWLGALLMLYHILWNKGLHRYESFGA